MEIKGKPIEPPASRRISYVLIIGVVAFKGFRGIMRDRREINGGDGLM